MAASLDDISLEADDEDIGILLVGSSGSGKSGSGNMILDKKAFLSRGGVESITRKYKSEKATINGKIVRVVDTPGFTDTEMRNESQRRELVIDEITLALIQFPKGFHAVVPVISYIERLPDEANKTMRTIIKLLDADAFKRHGVTIMTNGAAFKRDFPNAQNIDAKFAEWLNDLPDRFKWIKTDCNGRCVLFENFTESEEVKRNQRQCFMRCVERVQTSQRGVRYIPSVCRWSSEKQVDSLNSRLKVKNYLRTKDCLSNISDRLARNKTSLDESVITELKEIARDVSRMIPDKIRHRRNLESFSAKMESLNPQNVRQMASDICQTIETIQTEIYQGIKRTKYWYDLRCKVCGYFPSWCTIL